MHFRTPKLSNIHRQTVSAPRAPCQLASSRLLDPNFRVAHDSTRIGRMARRSWRQFAQAWRVLAKSGKAPRHLLFLAKASPGPTWSMAQTRWAMSPLAVSFMLRKPPGRRCTAPDDAVPRGRRRPLRENGGKRSGHKICAEHRRPLVTGPQTARGSRGNSGSRTKQK